MLFITITEGRRLVKNAEGRLLLVSSYTHGAAEDGKATCDVNERIAPIDRHLSGEAPVQIGAHDDVRNVIVILDGKTARPRPCVVALHDRQSHRQSAYTATRCGRKRDGTWSTTSG